MLIKKMYGNMMRFRPAVSSNFPGVSPNPEANSLTRRGEKTIPITVSAVRNIVITVNIVFANSHASFSFFSARYRVKTGMNAALTAPSATSRRIKFGIRYAVV